jgi:hypothetical protein
MARQISEIQQQMIDNIAADSVLGTLLTSTSKRAIYRLFTYVVAVAINALEQLMDIFTAEVEAVAAAAAPATPAWLQAQIFDFQYSATTPQVVQLINFAPAYPVVDETLRIITRCSVTTNLSNSVIIKVATGEPPAALSAPQLAALQSYVTEIGVAGVVYNVISQASDKLYVQANVYYQGQYSAVIKANVVAAIENFLAGIPFNGQVKISDIEDAITAVEGVTDVVLVNVRARADGTAFASGSFLVQNQQTVSRLWGTVAGYMVGETGTGNTLNDSLTFIAE